MTSPKGLQYTGCIPCKGDRQHTKRGVLGMDVKLYLSERIQFWKV